MKFNFCTHIQIYKIYKSVSRHQLFVGYFYYNNTLGLYSTYHKSYFFSSSVIPRVSPRNGDHSTWRFLQDGLSTQCIYCWIFYSLINFAKIPTGTGNGILTLYKNKVEYINNWLTGPYSLIRVMAYILIPFQISCFYGLQ